MNETELNRRQFLTCSLGAMGLCAAAPAFAATPIYRGRDLPVKQIEGLPVKKHIELKKALFWHPTGAVVQCTLCPYYCQLKPGQRGPCRIRLNKGGTLYTEIYNAPAVVATNAIEQGPFHHVLPGSRFLAFGTAGCNLRCKYCQNWQFSQTTASDTKNYDLSADQMVAIAKRYHCKGIMYTFTEAVISIEYALAVAKAVRKAGMVNALVTAAWIDEEPFLQLLKYIDVVRIDLKGFTEKFYREVTAGTLEPVKRAVVAAHKSGTWLEVINMVVHGLNDDPNTFRKMVKWLHTTVGPKTPLHVTRFYPAYKLRNLPSSSPKTILKLRSIALEEGMKYVYAGNCPDRMDAYATYCDKCGKMLIHRIGYITVDKNVLKNGKCPYCGNPIPGFWG